MQQMEEFTERYKHYSELERAWLCKMYTVVCDWLYPVVGVSLGMSKEQLAHMVVLKLQSTYNCLPVSSRFISVMQLVSTQHTSCFSSFTWSTNQFREWTREAEQQLLSHGTLPRANLILIGLLCDGRDSAQYDGNWKVKDAGGSVHCEVLSSSPLWLNRLMLFPTWNYLTHSAPGLEHRPGGYLELIESPVCVTPNLTVLDIRGPLTDAFGVKKAVRMLKENGSVGMYMSVYGEVCVISPVLIIRRKPSFCLILSEGNSTVAVLVTIPEFAFWRQCVRVGQSVCISALLVRSFRGWEGYRVLSVTTESHLHPNSVPHEQSEDTDIHKQLQMDTDTHLQPNAESKEAQVQTGPVRRKLSKIINYRGRLTGVKHAEAGLYEIDGNVLLCVAYQPLRNWGSCFRPGTEIELHNIHFMFRPSPFAPDIVLCACLRSSISVMTFSPLSTKVIFQRTESALVTFLLEHNLDMSEYLWLCYCYAALTDRLCPRWVCEGRVCVVAGRLLQFILGEKKMKRNQREIYKEMMLETHTCLLSQYRVSGLSESLYSVKKLCDWLQKDSWACLSLSALLTPSACHMTQAQLNQLLAWSAHTHTLAHIQTVLVGVLELSVGGVTVKLVDQTGSIDCVCVSSEQRGSINTAWIGCLVCVRQCTLVMERFMNTSFPSWKHLDQTRFITHKYCRVYICVCMEDLHILSPTIIMRSLLCEQEEDRMEKRKRTEEEEKDGDHDLFETYKALIGRRGDGGMVVQECEAGPSQSVSSWESGRAEMSGESCVTLLFHVKSKQGVAFRNVQSNTKAYALTLSFVVKVTRLGDVQVWNRDPKNCRVEERETKGAEITMDLQFVDSAVCWFPLLQPGSVYRLIALHTQDVSIFSSLCVPVRGGVSLHSNSTLVIQPKWRIHTVTLPLFLSQPEIPKVMSITEVLHTSSTHIISFFGVISERITIEEQGKPSAIQSLISNKDSVMGRGLRVRLTLQDVESQCHTLHVYLDLNNPYTPGLFPGATVYLYHFERKMSVMCNVYCKSLPNSGVTVAALGELKPHSPPPIMNLRTWNSHREEHSMMGQIRGHVVFVLSLSLQWTCCLCGNVFKQGACTQRNPSCDSTSAVFQAEAKVAVEDGTGEAQVWFPTTSIPILLRLDDSQWERLQQRVKFRGHVRIYARGQRMMCDVNPDDLLVVYLCWLCSSTAVLRLITITCKLCRYKAEEKKRKVRRGHQEVLTKFHKPLQLQCAQIHTNTPTQR